MTRRWLAVRYMDHSTPVLVARCWTAWGARHRAEVDRASGVYAPLRRFDWAVLRRDGGQRRFLRSGEVNAR